jgi:hypothetical protein
LAPVLAAGWWHGFFIADKKTVMKYGVYLVILILLVALVTGGLARCGGPGSRQPKKMAVDSSSPMGPAPDNNSANNPSLADTSYEKDRTRPITDSMKKDSGR